MTQKSSSLRWWGKWCYCSLDAQVDLCPAGVSESVVGSIIVVLNKYSSSLRWWGKWTLFITLSFINYPDFSICNIFLQVIDTKVQNILRESLGSNYLQKWTPHSHKAGGLLRYAWHHNTVVRTRHSADLVASGSGRGEMVTTVTFEEVLVFVTGVDSL